MGGGFCGLCSSLPLEFILPGLELSSWRCGKRAFSRSSIWLTCRLLRKLGSKLSRTLFTALRLLLDCGSELFKLESAAATAAAALLRGGGLGKGCREKEPSDAMVARDCDRLGGLRLHRFRPAASSAETPSWLWLS